MAANPHFYDYVHVMLFQEDGFVKFVDGAGQCINTIARGRYKVSESPCDSAEVAFSCVVEVNPRREEEEINHVPDFRVKLTRETGVFAFAEEVVWRIEDEQEHPYLLYTTRYVFDRDPLAFSRPKQMKNLYHLVEDKEMVESARCYYPVDGGQRLTLGQLREQGINPSR